MSVIVVVIGSLASGIYQGVSEDGRGWTVGIIWIVGGLAFAALFGPGFIRDRSPGPDAG